MIPDPKIRFNTSNSNTSSEVRSRAVAENEIDGVEEKSP